MTNREMFLLATSILFASTTAGLALQGVLHKKPHDRPGYERHHDGKRGKYDHFGAADANKDGFVTRDEMQARQQAKLEDMFATVDTDKDGRLTREEMDKGRELMRAKMKAKFEAEKGEGAKDVAPAPDSAPAPVDAR